MNNVLFAVLVAIILSACEPVSRHPQQHGESPPQVNLFQDYHVWNTNCINGVVYYVDTSGTKGFMAPKYNSDGTIATCE